MRILLVEDDECTREVLTAFLKNLHSNIEVEVAAHGDDALRHYLERSYHLVVTDNVHPGMFGIELIELILAKNPLQPIILQTGNYREHIETFKQTHRAIPLLESRTRCNNFRTWRGLC